VDQTIKDIILELLDQADELVPIGSLTSFKSERKTIGYENRDIIYICTRQCQFELFHMSCDDIAQLLLSHPLVPKISRKLTLL